MSVHNWKEYLAVFQHSNIHDLRHTAKTTLHTKEIKSFTFVRDPLQHFISGIVEASFRKVCHNKERCAVKFVNNTTHNHSISVAADRAKGLLDMLLQGSVTAAEKQLAAREHFNVQSYAVLKFSPHFIGETAPPSVTSYV
jgi:hypothetical protein